ncbi:hypothetical protein SAMN05421538_104274 [Paracoccus isoporae]|uniref:Uncharacterized protein n=1 Tax=Paracoccus isoporae TaxID=591205 RepID=A0A1G7AWW8_9RHOB|nr:hypothetical protein [Paracoccus isoporae]SDE19212.1 hypothetical protein SAMN05421538_104274 [Paracoccus isoporae]
MEPFLFVALILIFLLYVALGDQQVARGYHGHYAVLIAVALIAAVICATMARRAVGGSEFLAGVIQLAMSFALFIWLGGLLIGGLIGVTRSRRGGDRIASQPRPIGLSVTFYLVNILALTLCIYG